MITFVRLPWNNSEYSQTPVMHASLIHCPPHCMGFLNASTSERFFSGNQNVQIKGVCVSITLLQNKPRVSSLLIRKNNLSAELVNQCQFEPWYDLYKSYIKKTDHWFYFAFQYAINPASNSMTWNNIMR